MVFNGINHLPEVQWQRILIDKYLYFPWRCADLEPDGTNEGFKFDTE